MRPDQHIEHLYEMRGEFKALQTSVELLTAEIGALRHDVDTWRGGITLIKWLGGIGGIAGIAAFAKTWFMHGGNT